MSVMRLVVRSGVVCMRLWMNEDSGALWVHCLVLYMRLLRPSEIHVPECAPVNRAVRLQLKWPE